MGKNLYIFTVQFVTVALQLIGSNVFVVLGKYAHCHAYCLY